MNWGKLATIFFIFSLFVMPVFGSGLFSLLFNNRQSYYPSGGLADLNGADVNFHFVWAEHFFLDLNALSGFELDGGFANSVYLVSQYWDGGSA